MKKSDLTPDEHTFLREHRIHWENLYDARNLSPTGWNDDAKRMGFDFGLGVPCLRGHRLRDRKGHCIQCKTANIAFIRRSSAAAYVYIAASRHQRLYKIGSTIDWRQREIALRREEYAGCADWKIICVCHIEGSGRVEFAIHKNLSDFKVARSYKNAGQDVEATEAFKCSLAQVWQAYQSSVGWRDIPASKKSRLKNFEAFDFGQ
jgi:hypothetical protein